jgi:precorrin-2 dehydrogenase/sirohydrochlorin ferrochelatase
MPGDGAHYPVNLLLSGRPALVVGGGTVAAGKAAELVECGAAVTVVAPDIGDDMAALSGVEIARRPYEVGEAAGYAIVIAATDDPEVNRQVYLDATEHRALVNSVDDPENCTFTTPARVRQGSLLVTVSTQGRSPAVATWLRRQLESRFGPEYGVLVDMVAEERDAIRAQGRSTMDLDWQGALESGMLELIREGRLAEAKERLQACLSSPSG